MDIKDLKVIAYTFARYSYQFDMNTPCYTSKAKIYGHESNCDHAMKCLVDDDYRVIKELAEKENWAHKYVDIDECSDESDYEIRGYDTKNHDNDFVVLYRYIAYPIFNSSTNSFIYRGFVISPVSCLDEKGELKFKMKAVSDEYNIDLDVHDNINEVIDSINHFLAYMNRYQEIINLKEEQP